MLTIRAEQVDALREASRQRFLSRTAALLVAEFPDRTAALPGPALLKWVERGVALANTYDFLAPDDVQRFLRCLIQLRPEYQSAPGAIEVLASSDGAAADRLRALEVWTVQPGVVL